VQRAVIVRYLLLIGYLALYLKCRYIGTKTYNVYGVGSGQIWLEKFQCNGTERDIDECSHNAWGAHSCEHHDYVAISCNTGRPSTPGFMIWKVKDIGNGILALLLSVAVAIHAVV